MTYYKRKLPHWQISGAEYFVTIRLAGSLPGHVIKELQRLRIEFKQKQKIEKQSDSKNFERKIFKKYESLLDTGKTGPLWLKIPEIADIISESLHYRNGKKFDLYTYCIMSNHVHIVFRHLNLSSKNQDKGDENLLPITKIMKDMKSYTALKANKFLQRTGPFWQQESYDRLIRDETELENVIRYTIYNPVKAKLINEWSDWPYTYLNPEFLESF